MIFPFGIEKEAEIYCNSAKYALAKQADAIKSQIDAIADSMISNNIDCQPYSTVINYIVAWAESQVKREGWDLRDEDGVAWWIGIFVKSYLQAFPNNNHSFEEIFKSTFIKYFQYK